MEVYRLNDLVIKIFASADNCQKLGILSHRPIIPYAIYMIDIDRQLIPSFWSKNCLKEGSKKYIFFILESYRDF